MTRTPIYGGPDDGLETDASGHEHWSYRNDTLAPFVAPHAEAPEMPHFHYFRVPAGDGTAFVPRDDRDLIAASQQTDGEGPAADALCAEIERRGLDI